jgi:hypothetical protein
VPNPTHLLIDSDVLFQLFISRQTSILSKLRNECGILPAIVPEVETEVRWNGKFRNRFEPQLQRLIKTGNVVVLDTEETRKLFLERGIPQDSLASQLRALDQRGQEYHAHVGAGEAYTHATATTLGFPAVSNDGEAIRILIAQGKSVSCPTLRFIDLLLFARKAGWIDDAAGESARSHLHGDNEHLPGPFKAKDSFADNWSSFGCRVSSDKEHATLQATSAHGTMYLKVGLVIG